MTLITEIYRLSKTFPNEESFGLTAQMRRCAVSIPSNIAEGYGRNANHDFVRFLRIATGSLYELQTHIEISMNLGYLNKGDFDNLYEFTKEIERMLFSLTKKLREKK